MIVSYFTIADCDGARKYDIGVALHAIRESCHKISIKIYVNYLTI